MRLHKAFRSRRSTAVTSASSSQHDITALSVRRRSVLELAGSCICIAILAVAGMALRNNALTANAAPASRSVTLSASSADQADGTTDAAGANVSQDGLAAGQTDQAGQTNGDHSTSISISADSSDQTSGPAGMSNQVTVDGKAVTAPTNGSTIHTITTPDGNQTVITNTSLSNSQSTGGDNTSNSFGSSDVFVHSSSNSSNFKEVN